MEGEEEDCRVMNENIMKKALIIIAKNSCTLMCHDGESGVC